MAYAYMRGLEGKRDERHECEAQWDAHHRLGPIARWVINKVRAFHDRIEEEEIQDAIDLAAPMADFTRFKQQHKKQ